MTENEMTKSIEYLKRIEYLERLCNEYVKDIINLSKEIYKLRERHNDWDD